MRRQAWAPLLLAALLANGCDTILGIQEMDYSPPADAEADGASDATNPTEAGADAFMPEEAQPDAPTPDAPMDVAADVTYPSCATDGSTGEVCGPVTYGAWSACSYAAVCDNSGSRTSSVMTPTCAAGACTTVTSMVTDMTGCNRNTDGTSCGTGMACSNQTCVCAPQCANKNCGPDGCGGSCGSCSGGNYTCGGNGVCQCTPTAGCVSGGDVGNVCAPDDGCGGPCDCNAANGEMCGSGVCCHEATWFCSQNSDCCSGSCIASACN